MSVRMMPMHATSTPPRHGLTVALGRECYTFVSVSGETRSAHTILRVVTEPGAGTPLHVHHREDEAWMIVEGTYAVRIGDRVRTLGPGTFVVAPKGVPHGYTNVGGTQGTLMATVWPAARFELLLMELGRVVPEGGPEPAPALGVPADVRAFAAAAPKYGIEVVPERELAAEQQAALRRELLVALAV